MTIEEIYKKGTAPQLWAALDPSQRSHFLIDHYDMFGTELESDVNKYAQKFSHSSYKDLPKQIRQQVVIHHAMGYYNEGGTAGILKSHKIDPVINKLLMESSRDILALEFDDSEILYDEASKRQFYVKRIGADKFIIEESGSLAKGIKPSILITSKQLMKDQKLSQGGRAGYLTPNKKHLLSKITSIKEKMQKVKDPQVLESIKAHIRKLEDILNKKTPTATKIQNWKQEKAKRLSRK